MAGMAVMPHLASIPIQDDGKFARFMNDVGRGVEGEKKRDILEVRVSRLSGR